MVYEYYEEDPPYDDNHFEQEQVEDREGVIANSDVKNKEETAEDKSKILASVWEKSEGEQNKRAKTRAARPRLKLTERELVSEEKGLPALKAMFDQLHLPEGATSYEQLDTVMNKMEYWVHNLYPQMNFNDCLETIERLGHKRIVKNALKRLRLGMSLDWNEAVVGIKADEEADAAEVNEVDMDGEHMPPSDRVAFDDSGPELNDTHKIGVARTQEESDGEPGELDDFLSAMRDHSTERISAENVQKKGPHRLKERRPRSAATEPKKTKKKPSKFYKEIDEESGYTGANENEAVVIEEDEEHTQFRLNTEIDSDDEKEIPMRTPIGAKKRRIIIEDDF